MARDADKLGQILREKRRELGLGERRAGALIGISGPWVRNLEKGSRPSVEVCYQLADAYGLDPAELLDLAGWPPDSPRPKAPLALDVGPAATAPREDILNIILTDERLLPEARIHLANEYSLLLRLRATTSGDELADLDRRLEARLDRESNARRPPQQ